MLFSHTTLLSHTHPIPLHAPHPRSWVSTKARASSIDAPHAKQVSTLCTELDLASKVKTVEALVSTVVARGARHQNPAVRAALDEVTDALRQIKELGHAIDGKLDEHEERWFPTWRSAGIDEEVALLRHYGTVLDRRVDMLIKMMAIPSEAPGEAGGVGVAGAETKQDVEWQRVAGGVAAAGGSAVRKAASAIGSLVGGGGVGGGGGAGSGGSGGGGAAGGAVAVGSAAVEGSAQWRRDRDQSREAAASGESRTSRTGNSLVYA